MKENTAIIAATKFRLALMRNGHIPIPLFGKEPPVYGKNNGRESFQGWQKLRNVSAEMIEMWQKIWPDAVNTGVLGTLTIGLDIDILIPDAADTVERLARDTFEERGEITVRFGLAPKRLIPLRTDEPFAKITRSLIAPSGDEMRIEILADGAQFVADGIHPKIHERYRWFGRSLDQIPREDLPYVREADMRQFVDAAVRLLIDDFGFSEKSGARDDDDGSHESGEEPQAEVALIVAALAVIPNDDLNWDDWNRVGMATWRATSGAEVAFTAFDSWSRKSRKYDAKVTAQKWAAYFKSPPTHIGAGTVFYLADHAEPNWRRDYEARKNKGGITVLSKAEFLADFVPPDYLVDGVLQRRFIYSLTAVTGHGKTALALDLARVIACLDSAARFGPHAVEKGRVIYFVGENPDDVRCRIIGDDSTRNDDPTLDRIHFIPGVFDIAQMRARVITEVERIGGIDLVIVDTSAAYFLQQDENSNTQIGAHARMLRSLTTLPGGPCVIPLCHPIKHVTDPSQLLPRGGGAFLNEMDGNLTLWLHDENLITLNYNKMRGPGFEPITFKLEKITTPALIDSKRRQMPTVHAVAISGQEEAEQEANAERDEDQLLAALTGKKPLSIADLARACSWLLPNGEPYKSKVQRVIARLQARLKCLS